MSASTSTFESTSKLQSTSPRDACQCRFCCLCCMHLNELDRPFGYQMSLRDCGYRCGCICHAFGDGGSQSTISDVTMILSEMPIWTGALCRQTASDVGLYLELHAGEDNIKIAGDDAEQLTPRGLWTIGTCGCERINSDRVEEDHHVGRSVTSIILTV